MHEHHVSQAAAVATTAATATAPSLLVAASSDKQRTIVLPPPPGGKKHGCSASIASNSNSGSSSSVTLADCGPSPNKKRRCTGGNVEPTAAAAAAVPIAALAEASRRASRLIAKLQPDAADDETTTTMPVAALAAADSVGWRATIMDPDEFFDDPAEVAAHRAEIRLLADWQIIDALAEADNDLDDIDDDDDESDAKFQTTCFTGGDNDDDSDFVSVQRAPSVISLGSYTDDPYGLFASPYGWVLPKYPEAMYATFECDIQCGVPMLDVTLVSAFEEIMVETFRLDGVGGTTETLIAPRPPPETSDNIARRFRLDDAGSLCLNIEHIGEERGFGFLMRRSRRVYRNVAVGQMVDERMRWSGGVPDGELDAVRLDGRRRMKQLLRRLWRCLFGGAAAARQRVHAKRGKRSARRHVREHLNPA